MPVPDHLTGFDQVDLIVISNVALSMSVAIVVCTQSTRVIFSLLCVFQLFCLQGSSEVEILFVLNFGDSTELFFASQLPLQQEKNRKFNNHCSVNHKVL